MLGRTARAWSLLACAGLFVSPVFAGEGVSFQRDVRPILSDNCFQCHGPDPESRKAGLRLDTLADAMAAREGGAAIVPGDPGQGSLMARILATDPDDVMPPPSSGKQLNPEQIETLRAWIAQGAEWPEHWAFTGPVRPSVPEASQPEWTRNAIDHFVLDRLRREGLDPSPEADPLSLLRRLSLDLTGLPPTDAEIAAYLAENPDTAYAAAVERLLASPHYGERWARDWLDAAQYADSDGFEKDKPRFVWFWRDWVIRAFNDNMPYDQFIREQIAGDLMPNATQDQIVATGFLRNSMINEEGGIDPEQFRMEALFNRLDVVGRAMLGLTVNCAQCHTHKYDPLTHAEYFQMLAYLNSAHEAAPTVYTSAERTQRDATLARVAEVERTIKEANPDWDSRMRIWEEEVRAQPNPDWRPLDLAFDDTSAGGQKCVPLGDGSYLASGYAPTRHHPKMTAASPLPHVTALRVELLTDPNLPRNGPGRSIYGSGALSEIELRLAPADRPVEEFDQWQRAEFSRALADVNVPRRPLDAAYPDRGDRKAFLGSIRMAIDGDGETAWTTDNGPERRNQPREAVFILKEPLTIPEASQLGVKLSQLHGGWNSDDNQNNNLGRFRISVTADDVLPSFLTPRRIRDILDIPREERSPAQQAELFSHWRSTVPAFAIQNLEIERLWREMPQGTTQLVYQEREVPRVTHRLDRGDFLSPAEPVSPGVPAFLHPLPEDAPPNRLGLAAWLADRRSPTTARAFVNRVWIRYFGTGITDTPSDLGVQGAPPTHPELLDWLAVEFMDSGWDVKHLHRLITNSATYRQDSGVSPALRERDPANRLLARGARFRVEGEVVRDIALAASGLLQPAVGGPSVYPPAPEFLFEPPASYGPKIWNTEQGENRYRRGLYTFRFRSVPHPVLQAFDTPPGDSPCVGRARSNTPLQALATLNESTFMECARALAARTLGEGGDSDASRIAYVFRRCVAREPMASETETLRSFLEKQRQRIAGGQLNPAQLLEGEPDAELAAWTLAARVLLNLDETITRQ